MRLRRCSTAKAKPCARQDTALGAHLTKGCTWEEGQECGPAGGSDEPMRGSRTEGGKCSGIVIVREREKEREHARKRVRKRGKYVPYVTIRFEGPRRLLAGGGMRSLEVGWDGIGRTKQGQTIASKSTVDKRAKGKVTMSRDGGQARFTHRHTAGFSVGTRSSSQLVRPRC